MSLLPLLLDIADDLSESSFHRRSSFAGSISPSELEFYSSPYSLLMPQSHTGHHYRPRCSHKLKSCNGNKKRAAIGKDGFQVCVDVQHFAPNEISVKTVDDTIVVEGKHEERQDQHGYISRQFTRRYTLPDGYDAEHVVSQLSSDGVLTIKAPPPAKAIDGNNVRIVQIQQTGPAHLTVKRKGDEESEEIRDKVSVEKMTE